MLAVQHSVSPSHSLAKPGRDANCTYICFCCSQFTLDSASCRGSLGAGWMRSNVSRWPNEKSFLTPAGLGCCRSTVPYPGAQEVTRALRPHDVIPPHAAIALDWNGLCTDLPNWTSACCWDIDWATLTAVPKMSICPSFSKISSLMLPQYVI